MRNAVFFILVLMVSAAPTAGAAEFLVDQFSIDAPDPLPGDGVCSASLLSPESGGQCTLRAAIMESNVNPGRDTVLIPWRDPVGILSPELLNDPFFEGLPVSQPIDLALGPLEISQELQVSISPAAILIGNIRQIGELLPVIDATTMGDRIFEISGMDDVRLQGLALTGGDASGSLGGAVAVANGTGEVTLFKVDLFGNTASAGAAVATSSPLNIFDSRIRDNLNDGDGFGSIVEAFGTHLTIGFSSLYSNQIIGDGSVVRVQSSGPTDARLRVLSSTITENDAPRGVFGSGDTLVQLQNATVSANAGNAIRLQFDIAAPNPPRLLLSHTVFANQTQTNCDFDPETVFLITDNFNLSDDASCSELAAGPTNLNERPAGLRGPAADALSWHRIDLPNVQSPLIDAGGTMAFHPDQFGCVEIDQRSQPRPQRGSAQTDPDAPLRCDIGAIEARPEPVFSDGFE